MVDLTGVNHLELLAIIRSLEFLDWCLSAGKVRLIQYLFSALLLIKFSVKVTITL